MARFLGPPFSLRPADECAEVCCQVLTGLVMVWEGPKFLQSMAEGWSVREAAAVAGMQANWGILNIYSILLTTTWGRVVGWAEVTTVRVINTKES